MSDVNILQDVHHVGWQALRDWGAAENVTLRRNVFTVTDPVRDIKTITSVIEATTIALTRRFTNEERAAGLTVSGSAVWILDGLPLTEKDFRPAIADLIISPSLGTYIISEILFEDNIARMNWEVTSQFSNQSSG